MSFQPRLDGKPQQATLQGAMQGRSQADMIFGLPVDSLSTEELDSVRTMLLRSITQNFTELEFLRGSGQDLSRHEQHLQELQQRFQDIELEQSWRSRSEGQKLPEGQTGRTPSVSPPAAAQDATRVDLGIDPKQQVPSLKENIQRAWQTATSRREGSTGLAAQEGAGPDILNLLSNALGLVGDPIQSANPMGAAAKLGSLPGKFGKLGKVAKTGGKKN